MLDSLIELSREPSSEKRREVLQHVSQLFCDGADSFSDRENVLFGEILVRLLDQVPVDDRIGLSKKIGSMDETPHEVVLKLANDLAEVAAPVLEFSNVLTESDLVDLAGSHGQDHLMAISRRSYLPEAITDIIVERGEDRVLTSVARNAGAQFSQAGFMALAERAPDTFGLGDIIANRTDIPRYVAEKIMPMLAEDSRKRLQFLLDNDHGQVQTLLQSTQEQVEHSRKFLRRERIEVRLMMSDVHDGRRTVSDAVAQLVQEKRVADVAHILGELSNVPISHVTNAFHKTDATAIAAVCKSLAIDSGVYEQLSMFRCEC